MLKKETPNDPKSAKIRPAEREFPGQASEPAPDATTEESRDRGSRGYGETGGGFGSHDPNRGEKGPGRTQERPKRDEKI